MRILKCSTIAWHPVLGKECRQRRSLPRLAAKTESAYVLFFRFPANYPDSGGRPKAKSWAPFLRHSFKNGVFLLFSGLSLVCVIIDCVGFVTVFLVCVCVSCQHFFARVCFVGFERQVRPKLSHVSNQPFCVTPLSCNFEGRSRPPNGVLARLVQTNDCPAPPSPPHLVSPSLLPPPIPFPLPANPTNS